MQLAVIPKVRYVTDNIYLGCFHNVEIVGGCICLVRIEQLTQFPGSMHTVRVPARSLRGD